MPCLIVGRQGSASDSGALGRRLVFGGQFFEEQAQSGLLLLCQSRNHGFDPRHHLWMGAGQQRRAGRGRRHQDAAVVVGIASAHHQTFGVELRHPPAQRGRLHLDLPRELELVELSVLCQAPDNLNGVQRGADGLEALPDGVPDLAAGAFDQLREDIGALFSLRHRRIMRTIVVLSMILGYGHDCRAPGQRARAQGE